MQNRVSRKFSAHAGFLAALYGVSKFQFTIFTGFYLDVSYYVR